MRIVGAEQRGVGEGGDRGGWDIKRAVAFFAREAAGTSGGDGVVPDGSGPGKPNTRRGPFIELPRAATATGCRWRATLARSQEFSCRSSETTGSVSVSSRPVSDDL